MSRVAAELRVPDSERAALAGGTHHDPHRILGVHPSPRGHVVRAFHPRALRVELMREGGPARAMTPLGEGLFATRWTGTGSPAPYTLRFHLEGGAVWERDDPYRFAPGLGELDLHLIGEGRHRRLWQVLGAQPRVLDGAAGTAFAVWAPSARGVSVVGDFCSWDGRLLPMRSLGAAGIWELFVPGVGPGALYKFEVRTAAGGTLLKADPLARSMEPPPGHAARVDSPRFTWGDEAWVTRRARSDPYREPLAIYEVHLGSWARVPEEGNRHLRYRELAPRLVEHVKRFGFTHLELLPVAEHPFYGSWGYQVSGYYAPTARYGSPDDLRFFVDYCHRHGIGVILDWVPAHFPRDSWALSRFDGSALYEHEDPRRGAHPDWGTLIFNYGRNEVRNFLTANALYWLREFHVDGLRVDAVASMLYLDYSRGAGEWLPNVHGGRENLEAIEFLREVNALVHEEVPGALMIAEESTSWAGVTHPVRDGGLGFDFKWNMGWMHDTLEYFGRDPVHRGYHQDRLTFAMVYEYSERFVNPLSHDEVVHMKGSLLSKMPGDDWQRFANLRLLLAYLYTRPGKKLLFMGTELAPDSEWSHERSLDWRLGEEPRRRDFARFLEALGRLYRERPSLWRGDPETASFEWIDCSDHAQSVVSYVRRAADEHLVVVLNLTPVPRDDYRIGVPGTKRYAPVFCSDDAEYGGGGYGSEASIAVEPVRQHGRPGSIALRLPPLAALVLAPAH